MNIFITGGTTGIGYALTKYYLEQGHKVGICARDTNKFYSQFPTIPANLFFYEVDVVNKERLHEAFINFCEHTTGKLDLVIANAGIGLQKKSKLPDLSIAREMINVNILGVINTLDSALQMMCIQNSSSEEKYSGHIVVIASVAGFVGLPRTGVYSATKAFTLKLWESYAIDLKQYGLTFTAIAPGFIDTPLTQSNNHPMPFLMPAEKAAKLIVRAIEKKKELYIFPFRMKIIILILYYLPRSIYKMIMRFYFNVLKRDYFQN
ncbi:MAG: SDR family NAD(P)-dependent oxidoreductase [Oligoflexia bacterium]|nr:SDR family NAD(P)-dependent oxidoreductase [Oligoflexia bacterium]